MPKVNIGDIVHVYWRDHFSRQNGWQNLKETKSYVKEVVVCQSAGLVVSQDATQLIVAQNWHPTFDKDNDVRVADFMQILKSTITNIHILKKKAA